MVCRGPVPEFFKLDSKCSYTIDVPEMFGVRRLYMYREELKGAEMIEILYTRRNLNRMMTTFHLKLLDSDSNQY